MALSRKLMLGLWLSLLPLFWPHLIQADEPPLRLVLRNLPLQDERLLVMTLQLENVSDLYGAQILLKYDPAQLKVRDEDPRLEGVQIAPGPLLAFDDRFVAVNKADAQTGLIDFVFTLLKPAVPISESGVLATVAFEVTGDSPLTVEVVEAKFVSSQLTAIPVATTALMLAEPQTGNEVVSLPTQGIIPWGWGWAIAGVFGLVVAAFLLLGLLPKQGGVTPTQPTRRRMPGVTVSPTRTAVLLTEQGYRAMQQGDSTQAYDRFSQAIELDPANAAAWLGKGLVAQQITEKRICLQRVLALDPGNARAQAELQLLDTSMEGF